MKCNSCGTEISNDNSFCPNCGKKIESVDGKNEITNDSQKSKSKVALVLSLIPVIIFLFCLIYSGGSTSEGGVGAIWWIAMFYFMTVGVPLYVASLILGIESYKAERNRLSLISIILNILLVVGIIIVFSL